MPYGLTSKVPEYALVTALTLLSAESPEKSPQKPCLGLTLRFDLR